MSQEGGRVSKFGGMAKDQASYDRETEAFADLNGKFKHYCPEWDFMAIDETCAEFAACLCFGREQQRKESAA
jgi:hypothetical protein